MLLFVEWNAISINCMRRCCIFHNNTSIPCSAMVAKIIIITYKIKFILEQKPSVCVRVFTFFHYINAFLIFINISKFKLENRISIEKWCNVWKRLNVVMWGLYQNIKWHNREKSIVSGNVWLNLLSSFDIL